MLQEATAATAAAQDGGVVDDSLVDDEVLPNLLLLDAIWWQIKLIRRGEGRCPRRRSWTTSTGAR